MFSCIICCIINYILKPPTEIMKNFEFSFDDIRKSLKSEININCYNKFNEKNCINLDNNGYNLKLSLQLMRNQAYQHDKYKNFEVQINLLGIKKKETFKKVIFIERYDFFIEMFYDVFYFPFRLLGYYNYHNLLINFMDDFDDNKFNLEKIEILINDHFINVKKATLILNPYVGWISFILGILRFFIIPIVFLLAVFLQLATYLGTRVILGYLIIENVGTPNGIRELTETAVVNNSLIHPNITNNNTITENNNNSIISDNTSTTIN